MIHKNKNYSLTNPACSEGDTFEECNLCQAVANTVIGCDNLTFINCNLLNVELNPTWTVTGGLKVQKSMCSHIHSDWGLTPCPEYCIHWKSDDIGEDGIEHNYEDTVL